MDEHVDELYDAVSALTYVLHQQGQLSDEDVDYILGRDSDEENGTNVPTNVPKEKTVGVAVSEEMHAFYRELKADDSVDLDPAEALRDHLHELAKEHDHVYEKAMRKLEIDREM